MLDTRTCAIHINRVTLPTPFPMESSNTTPSQEALRWFVRARAADFGSDERQRMESWLDADPTHRREFERLHDTWGKLDSLEPHIDALRPAAPTVLAAQRPAMPPPTQSWRVLPALAGAMAALSIAALLFLTLHQVETLRYETPPGEHLAVTVSEGIETILDADSAIKVVHSNPPRIELLRGNAYFAVNHNSTGGGLEVMVGQTRIRDIGTRFAVAAKGTGGYVAVAEGLVEIRTSSTLRTAGAGQRVDFDAEHITGERKLAEEDVAPWRNGQWRFAATQLAEIAAEMGRQQRIRLDIPDPKVAALTVSGNFDIEEPDRVLWAVAQVHGLKTQRLGERHFQLGR